MSNYSREKVRALLDVRERSYRKSASRWKAGYRILLVGSAVLSTSAAIVGKLDCEFEGKGDIAAILAGLSAVIMTLIAALDFETNWRINRKSRHAVQVIQLELEKSTVNTDQLIRDLQDVIVQWNEALNKED